MKSFSCCIGETKQANGIFTDYVVIIDIPDSQVKLFMASCLIHNDGKPTWVITLDLAQKLSQNTLAHQCSLFTMSCDMYFPSSLEDLRTVLSLDQVVSS